MSAGRHRLLPVVSTMDERTKTGMGRDAVSVVCCGVDEHCVGRRMKQQHAALDVRTYDVAQHGSPDGPRRGRVRDVARTVEDPPQHSHRRHDSARDAG